MSGSLFGQESFPAHAVQYHGSECCLEHPQLRREYAYGVELVYQWKMQIWSLPCLAQYAQLGVSLAKPEIGRDFLGTLVTHRIYGLVWDGEP